TSANGLTAEEVTGRRARFGANKLAHEPHLPLLAHFLRRLVNPLNLLLVSLATLSALLGDRQSPVMIFLMVVLSVSLSLLQERRSSKGAQKLRAMVHTTAAVIRQAEPAEVPIEALVPGDIVHLSAGDMVPADLRLLAAKDLFINQSALTGESLP